MGLDMRPMGKPKPGFEKRYKEIFDIIQSDNISQPSFLDKLKGKKFPTKEELIQEWFANQIPSYITIKAPMVGKNPEAEIWLKARWEEQVDKPPFDQFLEQHQGYYVISLAKEKDGVPCYIAFGQDENVFRGEFLRECAELIGEDLVNEAWGSKLADETLDYGNRLMEVADKIAKANNLEYLKNQQTPPDKEIDEIETQIHIVFTLAKWLIFYGENGHGYEADF